MPIAIGYSVVKISLATCAPLPLSKSLPEVAAFTIALAANLQDDKKLQGCLNLRRARLANMGDSKRRKEQLGEKYGTTGKDYILPNVPITKAQAQAAYDFTSKGAWIGIGLLAAIWIIARIGVSMGWWGH